MTRLLASVLVPYYILLSFDFVLYACPGFVIVFVFFLPHIKLVYLAFFFFFFSLSSIETNFISFEHNCNFPFQ